MAAPHSNLASRAMRARSPDEAWMIAHSPEGKSASPAASRPPYLKLPSFCMSIRVCTWRTCSGLLILVASGTLWIALNCSNCAHVGHAVVKPHGLALAARIFWAAARRSVQVWGGLLGSSPAFLKASLL